MQKLILTCDSCSQRMQVPRSAIGRTGMCPSCGATIRISANNTTAVSRNRPGGTGGSGRIFNARNLFWRGGAGGQPSEDAKQRFGRAVDLFYNGKHAEALATFDSLAREYQDNPDIEAARQQCLAALRQGRGGGGTLAIENQMEGGWGGQAHGVNDRLDEETLIRVVTEKLVRGRSDEAQLHAAEIACKLLGIDGSKRIVPEPEDEPEPVSPGGESGEDEDIEAGADDISDAEEDDEEARMKSGASNGQGGDDDDILEVNAEEVAIEDDAAAKD